MEKPYRNYLDKIRCTIETYKVVCAKDAMHKDEYRTERETLQETLPHGFILNGPVSTKKLLNIVKYYTLTAMDKSDLNKVLFTKKEMEDDDLIEKIIKQIYHYMSGGHYGKIEVEYKGRAATVDYLKVVNRTGLGELVRKDVYGNAPLHSDKAKAIVDIIKYYSISIDGSLIKNNEIKALLYDEGLFEFTNGDDIVRYIVSKKADSPLLIKSRDVLNRLGMGGDKSIHDKINSLLVNNVDLLSQVFHRHKRIFLALKDKTNNTTINKISKLAKVNHVPIREAINKTFITKALAGQIDDFDAILNNVSIWDKFKYLNLLRIKEQEIENKFYKIRNGKCFYKPNNEIWTSVHAHVYDIVVESVKKDLAHLKDKHIKYPDNVDYGLPISDKQSVSHIPFGTVVTVDGPISAGMYWKNEWGARDLDMSAVSMVGRLGWGQTNTYLPGNDLLFSGDITNAPNGAIEFMTQNRDDIVPHVLINTIFAKAYDYDNPNPKYKIVVGKASNKKYIKDVVLEIETQFDKRGEIFGIIKSNKFVVHKAAISNNRMSSPRDKAFLPYLNANTLTMHCVFDMAGVRTNEPNENGEYDIDLSVEGITFDKLRAVFEPTE